MAEVTNELLYEVMTQVQARLAQVDGKADELKQEMQAFRTHPIGMLHELLGVHQELSGVHATPVRHEHRLDWIDCRLELRDALPQ